MAEPDERSAGGEAGDARAGSASQRDTLLGGVLIVGLVLAIVGIVLLWEISDRVDNLERDQPVPPPSQGSARQFAAAFDRNSKQLTVPLEDVRAELQGAGLDRIAPALAQLQANTSAVPAAVEALNRLIVQTQGVNALGVGVTGLRGDLGVLQRQIGGVGSQFPGLTGGLTSTRRGLAGATSTLGRVRSTLGTTNAGLEDIIAALEAATVELQRTREAIDRNSQCLETPVACGADNPGSTGPRR